jgi:CheY-like chemotaxis protein
VGKKDEGVTEADRKEDDATTEADGVGGGESLLVVDDDPFIARLLEIELRAAGYDVRVAADGALALDAARERCPDLVLADVMMPNMDGFELTRRLRQDPRTATVSVIMLTARGLSADKLEGFAIGADDYIVKPFDTPAGAHPGRAAALARHPHAIAADGAAGQRAHRGGDRRPR